MKSYKSLLFATVLGAVALTGCTDDFAEMNQDPTAVTNANVGYLFANGVNQFEPYGYLYWFYNAPLMYSWDQMAVPTGGMTTGILTTTANGDQGTQYINTLRYLREIENTLSVMPAEEAAGFTAYKSAVEVLTIYLGIFDSDMYGNLAYNEACRAPYGGTLTPGYDAQSTLYSEWLSALDNAISTFQSAGQTIVSTQDAIFKGDLSKWAKFANSLKLRLAVRLLAQDAAKAKQIAQQVASAGCGYINSLDDAVLFNKATVMNGGSENGNDKVYHWSNGFMDGTAASGEVINFMVSNLDPRVRFCYQKNDWNSKVVQAYYDRGKAIPDFIEKNVNYEVGADGKKKFVSWKGAGEPWVRYVGLPTDYNASTMGKYDWFFRYSDQKIADDKGGNEKSYCTYSYFQQMMVIGRAYNPTVPTAPGDVKAIPSKDRPWYGLYMGAAETNLYLAEFAMLNNDEAAAKGYYEKALEMSVREYDKLASLNQIAYYGTTYDYDPNEAVIDLKDGEIAKMMESADYAFTGTADEKMEKIYIQQLLNFTMYPNEQFVTSRRSGYPKIGSTLLARQAYADIPVTTIPRRFDTGLPVETDLMYGIQMENIQAQGFTPTSSGAGHSNLLHNERIWADQGAPEWGAGHK